MIYLARHGETVDNLPPARLMGHRDPPLTVQGRMQAMTLAAAARRAGVASIHTSPLRRAYETARIVGFTLGVEPVEDGRLAESARGRWEGRLLRDIADEEPERWRRWQRPTPQFRFPGGESLAEHAARALAAVRALRAAPQPALAVAHGGTIRCILLELQGSGPERFHELEVPHATLIALDEDSVLERCA